MLHTSQNCRDKRLVDEMGNFVDYVETFDDETFEATVFLRAVRPGGTKTFVVGGGETVRAKVTIPGAKLVDAPRLKD
jgi:hypothetical protein